LQKWVAWRKTATETGESTKQKNGGKLKDNHGKSPRTIVNLAIKGLVEALKRIVG